MKIKKTLVSLVLLSSITILSAYLVSGILDSERQPDAAVPSTTSIAASTTEDPAVRKAQEEELAKKEREKNIREHTVYIREGTRIFADPELSREILLTDKKLALYSLGLENGLHHVKKSYDDEEALGYVTEGSVHLDPVDFIENPLADCDYESRRKISDFNENPRVKVKGIYLSQSTVTGSGFESLLNLLDETDLNSMVIDIKDDNESLLFISDAAEQYNPRANQHARLSKTEARSLIQRAKDRGIYLIARIVTFKSPIYSEDHTDGIITYADGTPFTEDGELLWTSPMDSGLREYNILLAEEAADLGFHEIQFDYVRFPTVPQTDTVFYKDLGEHSKTYAIQSFLKLAWERLSQKRVYVSADVFGWAATATDDVDIGQHWEAITNVVDYICPMIYPSHYGEWNFGIRYPDTAPYETVNASIKDCLDRNGNVREPAIIRPWIQHFTASYIAYQGLEYIPYGRAEIKAQIQALADNGIDEYLLWNPSNDYEYEVLQ